MYWTSPSTKSTRYEDASSDIVDAILEEAGKWHRDVLQPLNQVGDQEVYSP